MLELLSPAGTYEAVIAAVQSGADSVYLGFESHNARRRAQNFTDEEFEGALRYCRARGCGVYVAMNTLISDGEMAEAVALAGKASDMGAAAIIIQDFGFGWALREALPDIQLHASTRMSVHNLAGVEAAAEMGVLRVMLARELSLEQMNYIAARSPIELGIMVHGDLCAAYSGQCYMSALTNRTSGSRGMCNAPCRLQYSMGGKSDDYPLSLRDNCLVNYVEEIERAGISCVKIEGRDRRPEYVALATKMYASAIKNKKTPTQAEIEELREAFSENGFTDGYFKADLDGDMFGARVETGRTSQRFFSEIRREYQNAEIRRVPVKFYAIFKNGEKVRLGVRDADGYKAAVQGDIPTKTEAQGLTREVVSESLYRTGGTPFQTKDVESLVEPGLQYAASDINELRQEVLLRLLNERSRPPIRRTGAIPAVGIGENVIGSPVINLQVSDHNQLTPALAEIGANILYVPLQMLSEHFERTIPFSEQGTKIVGVLPRVFSEGESAEVITLLKSARKNGVREVLLGNMGHIKYGVLSGFKIRGDFGLNAFNSRSLDVLCAANFESATASFELRLQQIKELNKPLPLEMIAYGRLPLMLTRQCIIKHSFGTCSCGSKHNLSDRMGALFPVMRDFQCQNAIYDTKKLFLADRSADYAGIGLWGIRLLFTTESSRECEMVAKAYKGETGYVPNGYTRGLYYKGVE